MPVTDAAPDTLADLPRLLRDAEGFADVARALRAGRAGTIDGAWGSSAALSVAALAAEAPTTVLVVLAHPGDVDPWANDLHSFTGRRPAVFPAFESWPPEPSAFDETPGRRLRTLQKLATDPPRVLLATMCALMQPVPARGELADRSRPLRVGQTIDLDELGEWLVGNGYKRLDAVELPGEFSRRGGILDIFSLDAEDPVRLEFFGDEIESIRPFSAGSQRSLGELTEVRVVSKPGDGFAGGRGHLTEHLPADTWVVLVEPTDLHEQGKFFLEAVSSVEGLFTVEGTFKQLVARPNVTVSALPRPGIETAAHLRVESVERFSANDTRARDELALVPRPARALTARHNEAEVHRLTDVLAAGQ